MSDEAENPIALARVTPSSKSGAPRRLCAADGCEMPAPAGRIYHDQRCQKKEQMRRFRARQSEKTDAEMEIVALSMGSAVTRALDAESEDVPTSLSRLFAELRTDDASRYRSMGILFGYGCRRGHARKAIPIAEREWAWRHTHMTITIAER